MNLKNIKNQDFILIVFYSFLSHLYFTIRYSGRLADSDTGVITKTIQMVYSENTIFTYTNGYGFQTMSVILSEITGLTIQQLLILPLGFLYVIIAYPLFLQLTKQRNIAILATLSLSLLPDLLFFTSRGSHERFTVYLVLMTVFILMLYFERHKVFRDKVVFLLMFNISVFCLFANNLWFGALLTGVLITSIFLYIIFQRKIQVGLAYFSPILASLMITPIVSLSTNPRSLIFSNVMFPIIDKLINFNVIIPAFSIIILISYLLFNDKIRQLVTTLIVGFYKNTITTKNKYYIGINVVFFGGYLWFLNIFSHSVGLSFKSPIIWLLLTSLNWIVLLLSVYGFLHIVSNKPINDRSAHFYELRPEMFLLCLYVSSILVLLAGFAADFVGTGVGNNFKLRIFPFLMYFAIPLTSVIIIDRIKKIETHSYRNVLRNVFIVIVITLTLFSFLKATNDPYVSDKWIFYTIEEEYGMKWIETNCDGTFISTGIDERINSAYNYISGNRGLQQHKSNYGSKYNYYFSSEQILLRAKDIDSHRDSENQNTIYANDNVKLYLTTRGI